MNSIVSKEIEYNEELVELFSSEQKWPIRNGNLIMFLAIVLILGMTFFIQYPESLNGDVSIHIVPSSSTLLAKKAGTVVLKVKEGDNVLPGDTIGYLKNSVSYNNVIYFSNLLKMLNDRTTEELQILDLRFREDVDLGEMQQVYASLFSLYNKLKDFKSSKLSGIEEQNIRNQIEAETIALRYNNQSRETVMRELALMKEKFRRDSILFSRKVMSKSEIDNSTLQLQPYIKELTSIEHNIATAKNTLLALKTQIVKVSVEREEHIRALQTELSEAILKAESQLSLWMNENFFISPIKGRVALAVNWTDQANVDFGKEVLSVIPTEQLVIGKADILSSGFGRIQADNKVKIELNDFPQEEYGYVTGEISSIPKIQRNGKYTVIIKLPKALVTDTKKELEIKEGMLGRVKVITRERHLIEHLFFQLKKSLQGSFSEQKMGDDNKVS